MPARQNSTQHSMHDVTLAKRGQTWRFVCDAGNEAQLLVALHKLASLQDASFDWFDAAVIAHAIGKRLSTNLQQLSIPMVEVPSITVVQPSTRELK